MEARLLLIHPRKIRNILHRHRHDRLQVLRQDPLPHSRILQAPILPPVQRLLRPRRLVKLRQLRRRHLLPQVHPGIMRQVAETSVVLHNAQPLRDPRPADRQLRLRPDREDHVIGRHERRQIGRPHQPRLSQRRLVGRLRLLPLLDDRPRDLPIQRRHRRPRSDRIHRRLAPADDRPDQLISRRPHIRRRIKHRPPSRHILPLESIHRPRRIPQRLRHPRIKPLRRRRDRRRHLQILHRRRVRQQQSRPLRHALTQPIVVLPHRRERSRRITRHTARPISQRDQLRRVRHEDIRQPRPQQIFQPMPRLMEIDLALRLPRVSHMIRRLIVRRMRPRRLRRRPPHLQPHRLIDKIHDRPEPPALPRSEILHALNQPAPRAGFSTSQHPIRSLQRRHPHRNRPRRHLRPPARPHLRGRDGWPSRPSASPTPCPQLERRSQWVG